jgi:hypothetical protein
MNRGSPALSSDLLERCGKIRQWAINSAVTSSILFQFSMKILARPKKGTSFFHHTLNPRAAPNPGTEFALGKLGGIK